MANGGTLKDIIIPRQYRAMLLDDDVYRWVVDNNLSNAKETSIKYRIYSAVEGRHQSAYGYKWSSRECNDYPNGGEIPQ